MKNFTLLALVALVVLVILRRESYEQRERAANVIFAA